MRATTRRMGAVSESAQGALIDRELVDRARTGDRGAFTELVRRHTPRARAMAFGACRDREAAHDIVQESFLRVWRHLDEFDGRASFGTWIYRIVANLAIDHHRRNRRTGIAVAIDDCEESQLPCTADDADPCAVAQEREYEARVSEAIRRLTPAHRNVLIARGEGKPYALIAQEQGIPVGTVMSRVFHARRAYAEVMRAEEIATGDERIATPVSYEGAEENENIMAKFPLEEVSRRRLTDGADIDSSKIRIVGVDEDVRDETEGLQPPEDPTGAEYRAFSENPVKFIKSHPAGIRYLTMMRQILANGGTDNPLDLVSVTIDGVRHWYVDDGRTRAVIDRVLGRLIRGEIEIPMLAGALDEARAKYKYGTLDKDQKIIYPILRGRSVDPQVGNDPEERRNRAFRQNTTRKGLDDAAKYRAACDDFRAAERREVAPNYQQIADNATMELPTIKSWHRLYKMPKQVQDRVWEGAISINAVLKFAGGKYTDEERIAQVEAMIAAGATSVRDAIATHRAASGGSDSTVDDEPRGEGDGGKRSQGDSERVERESTDAVTGSGTPRTPVQFAEKPLGARFADAYSEGLNGKGNQHETLALACMKLASKGWASLNKREKDAIKGVASLYGAVEDARKKAAEKAKKIAEARSKVNAPADPNAEALVDANK